MELGIKVNSWFWIMLVGVNSHAFILPLGKLLMRLAYRYSKQLLNMYCLGDLLYIQPVTSSVLVL